MITQISQKCQRRSEFALDIRKIKSQLFQFIQFKQKLFLKRLLRNWPDYSTEWMSIDDQQYQADSDSPPQESLLRSRYCLSV